MSFLSFFGNEGESGMNQKTKKNKNYIWNKIFRTNRRVMKMKDYEYKTIQTDGIGVSIIFQKVGKKYKENNIDKSTKEEIDQIYIDELNDEDLEICQKRKIVVVDPGNFVLSYMMDKNHKKIKIYCMSKKSRKSFKKMSKNNFGRKKKK